MQDWVEKKLEVFVLDLTIQRALCRTPLLCSPARFTVTNIVREHNLFNNADVIKTKCMMSNFIKKKKASFDLINIFPYWCVGEIWYRCIPNTDACSDIMVVTVAKKRTP